MSVDNQNNPFVEEVVEQLHTATGLPREKLSSSLTQPPSRDLGDIDIATPYQYRDCLLAQSHGGGQYRMGSTKCIEGAIYVGPGQPGEGTQHSPVQCSVESARTPDARVCAIPQSDMVVLANG